MLIERAKEDPGQEKQAPSTEDAVAEQYIFEVAFHDNLLKGRLVEAVDWNICSVKELLH